VWGAIITVFMLALALGYLAGGRWSLRSPTVRKLGTLLVLAAVSVLPTVWLGPTLLDAVAVRLPDPRFGSLLGSTLLFFVPTFFSGMVSPYAVRLLVEERATSGRHAGQLYFVSTFGSAAGTLLTSFYLVLYFEVNHIFGGLMAISLAIGLVAWIGGSKQ
jgi:MFS family permease